MRGSGKKFPPVIQPVLKAHRKSLLLRNIQTKRLFSPNYGKVLGRKTFRRLKEFESEKVRDRRRELCECLPSKENFSLREPVS